MLGTRLFKPNQALTVTTDMFAPGITPGMVVRYVDSDDKYHDCRLPNGDVFPFATSELDPKEADNILPAYFEGVEILRSLPTGTVIELLDSSHRGHPHSLLPLRARAASGEWLVPGLSGGFSVSTERAIQYGALVLRLPE